MNNHLEITGNNSFEVSQKKAVLDYINKNLSIKEIERLGKIAKSKTARNYLNNRYIVLKGFLKL
jgi:hypothetical protein